MNGKIVAAQWLVRKVPLLGEIWYCPKGPGVTSFGGLKQVVEQTRTAGVKALWMRLEPEVLADDVPAADIAALGLTRANRDPGSKSTIWIDLRPSEEDMLASFSQSARRNIRKAEAAGVTVEPVEPTGPNLETMFELMTATEARAHYGLRPRPYFLDYWRAQAQAGQAQLFFARLEGEVLAGIFVTAIGRRAWYKDGGSFDLHREAQATYLMQWEVMRWLKAQGIEQYDLVGVPNRERIGMGDSKQGLYDFKSKFNPEITEYMGAWDLAPSRPKYVLWLLVGERVAARLANRRPEKFLY
jgi:lipid II:glycine glycyltransferase (peptidoglycan interpeptide bridge formation enzyme)